MDVWRDIEQDCQSRLVKLVVIGPIVLAIFFILTASFFLAFAEGGRLPAIALGSAALALVIVAATAWSAIDRLIGVQLRGVAAFLRAAREGLPIEAPRGLGGVMGDIVGLVEDIVQTQVQVGRHIVGLQAVEGISQTITEFSRTSKAEHATLARALFALATDVRKDAEPSREDRLEALLLKIEQSLHDDIDQTGPAPEAKVELEGVLRRLDAMQVNTGAIAIAIEALNGTVCAGTTTTIKALSDAIKANSASADKRPQIVLDRLQMIETRLVDGQKALVQVSTERKDDREQSRLTMSVESLHRDVTRQVAEIGQRIGSLAHTTDFTPAISRLEYVADAMGGAVQAIDSAAVPEHMADLKLIVQAIDQIGREMKSSEKAQLHVSRELSVAIQANKDDMAKRSDTLQPVLENLFSRIALVSDMSRKVATDLPAVLQTVNEVRTAVKTQSDMLRTLPGHIDEGVKSSSSKATQDFELLCAHLERIGRQLESLEAAKLKVAPVVDGMSDIQQTLARQTEAEITRSHTLDTIAAGTGQALALLAGFKSNYSKAPPASSHEVVAGFEALNVSLSGVQARIAQLLKHEDSRFSAEKAEAEFARLHEMMGQISGQVETVVSSAARTTSMLDALQTLPLVLTNQSETVEIIATSVRQAMTILAAPATNDSPATSSELFSGLESLHDRLGAIDLRFGETLAAAAANKTNDAARASEAQRLMDAILVVRRLLDERDISVDNTSTALSVEPDGVVVRLDEINQRLDQLAERMEQLTMLDAPALTRDTPLEQIELQGRFTQASESGLQGRIDELTLRLDDVLDMLERADRRQASFEPILSQAFKPVVDRIQTLADVQQQGFGRLAGHFIQVSDAMSKIPQATASETRALLPPASIDLSGVYRRFDDMRDRLEDLTSTLGATDLSPTPGVSLATTPVVMASAPTQSLTAEPSFSLDATQYIGAEMDGLHGRFDQLAVRIEQLADVVEGNNRPFGSATAGALPSSGAMLETVSRDVLLRLDDLRAMLAKVGMADLPPVVQRLEASNRTLVNVITEWRSVGSPLTQDALERAFEGLHRQLREGGRSSAIMAAIQELRAVVQQVLPSASHGSRHVMLVKPDQTDAMLDLNALADVFHTRFDDIAERMDRLSDANRFDGSHAAHLNQNKAALSLELEAIAAPIRALTSLAETALTQLRAQASKKTSDRSATLAKDPALTAFGERLDGILSRLDLIASREAPGDAVLKHFARFTESFNDDALVSRLDLSNQAIVETLLAVETRFDQPFMDLHDSIADIRSIIGSSATTPKAIPSPETTNDKDGAFDATSLAAALRTMGGFMAAIEERYSAVETLAEDVSAGVLDDHENMGLAVFNEGIGEMRRLTQEFLDISSAISGELAEHARPQLPKVAFG
jgi:hypothetical protein